MVTINPQAVRRAQHIALTAGLGTGAIAACVFFLGWLLGWDTGKSLIPGGPTMKANTSLAYLFGALIILVSYAAHQTPARQKLKMILSAFIFLIGSLTLFEHLTGFSLGIDTLLFKDTSNSAYPGRMSPASAFSLLLLGLAFLLQQFENRATMIAWQTLSIFALTIAFLGLSGYVFNAASLHHFQFYFTLSLHANLCMALLSIGALGTRPNVGLMRYVVADGPNGVLVRTLLPAVLLLPLLLGTAGLMIQRSLNLDPDMSDAIFGMLVTVVIAALVIHLSERLRHADELQRGTLENLSASESRLAHAQRIAALGSFSFDLASRKLTCSDEMLRIYALEKDSFDGKPETLLARIHPDDRARVEGLQEQFQDQRPKATLEFRLLRPDGATRFVHCEAELRVNAEGLAVELAGIVHDITARRMLEDAVATNAKRYRSLFEYAPVSIWEYDYSEPIEFLSKRTWEDAGALAMHLEKNREELLHCMNLVQILDINQASVDLYAAQSKEELLARRMETLPEESMPVSARILASLVFGGKLNSSEMPRVALNGRKLILQTGWAIVPGTEKRCERVIFFCLDVTEHKRIEQHLMQSQKVESIGQLAGGVAHDFNNLLTSIIGFAELTKISAANDERILKNVNYIVEAAERGALLTQQLLAFARKKIVKFEVFDLNQVVMRMELMLRRLIGEHIELIIRPGSGLATVNMDSGSIEQVIMNLAVNARDAMPNGGKLTIELLNVTLDAEYAASRAEVTAGPYVMLAVSDSGSGMSPEILARIFEPFFTTKPLGKGTGLGLAMCHGIIKQAKGHIAAYSEPGKGTSIKIYVPRVSQEIPRKPVKSQTTGTPGGKETILIVEDDQMIRDCALIYLTSLGYDLLSASDGLAALQLIEDLDRPIHMLVTDVVMPKMGGRELADKMKSKYPDIHVLYASGYTENAIVHHGVLKEGVNFIQKPYNPSALAHAIRSVLEQSSRT